ncbi:MULTISPECIES: hypothetical protein [Cupriavidus]
MKAGLPGIGRRILAWLLMLVAACLFAIWYGGYSIDIFGRTTTALVHLHALPEDVLQTTGPFTGTVQRGTRCRLVEVDTKAMASFRVRCGELDGWTEETDAFDPPLGIGLFGG